MSYFRNAEHDSRMDEIIERDWNKFLNHINSFQQKKVDNEKR